MYQLLFSCLEKFLPKELILKILYDYRVIEHPLVTILKNYTKIDGNLNNYYYRNFGTLWYTRNKKWDRDFMNNQNVIKVNIIKNNYIETKLCYFKELNPLGFSLLNRSLNIMTKKLQCSNCKFCYYYLNRNIIREKSNIVLHINYNSSTKQLIYLEKKFNFNHKFYCTMCYKGDENITNNLVNPSRNLQL